MKLTFLGAAGTVTGSKYLLEAEGERILVDCGLYQGVKQLRLRNWAPFPVEPESVGAVLLTHAHIDVLKNVKHVTCRRVRAGLRHDDANACRHDFFVERDVVRMIVAGAG